jgi:NAD(P)-dependent dehydrogenase (short-subunit alcohol dehydrogenase family)
MGDRVYLITGSTDGIGKHTATKLALTGATVLVHGRWGAWTSEGAPSYEYEYEGGG